MYTQEEIRKVQLCALDILKEVVKVLDKMGIIYYANGGTAIGAVRHSGFIPWDDDLDIAIFREDYERFIVEGQKYLPKNLFIQNINTEPNYNLPFTKVRNIDTVFLEQNSKELDINHGVFIDIFPIDNAPNNIKIMKKLDNKFRLLKIKLSKGLTINESGVKKILRKSITIFNMHEKKYYINKFDKLATSVPKSNMMAIYGWGLGEYSQKEWFEKCVKFKFEDFEINLPKNYDAYLTNCFGDYMTPPPKEQQVPQHEPVKIRI